MLKEIPKSLKKNYKGCRLKTKIAFIYHELRYAWQRAWRGLDDREVFGFGYYFSERTARVLKEFKDWYQYEILIPESRDEKYARFFTKEESDEILDQIIYGLENCDADEIFWNLYPEYSDPFSVKITDENRNDYFEKTKESIRIAKENQQKSLELLAKYIYSF